MSQTSSEGLTSPCSSFDSSSASLAMSETSQLPSSSIGTSFLDLPPEIRLMIYSHLTTASGTVTIFARYSFGQNVSKSTLTLLHLNRLIRNEVEDFFYANQEFTFRSIPAVRNFIEDIGSRRASLIRKIRIDSWLCQRFASEFDESLKECLGRLKGVERVVVEEPCGLKRWRRRRDGNGFPLSAFVVANNWYTGGDFSLGPSGYLILGTWEKFASGKAYVNTKGGGWYWKRGCVLVFVADVTEYDAVVERVEKEDARSWAYQANGGKQPVELPSLNAVREKMMEYTSNEARLEAAKNKAREKRKRRQRQLR